MGKRIYTDAQREEATICPRVRFGQESTVKYVAEQIGMSASTVTNTCCIAWADKDRT